MRTSSRILILFLGLTAFAGKKPDSGLQFDPAFLAHEGDCSIATKKLSNALVKFLAPAEAKQPAVRIFLEPYRSSLVLHLR